MKETKKTALITGGGKRIGAAIVKHLHGCGMNVMIHYNQSSNDANMLNDKLNKSRKDSSASIKADLLEEKSYAYVIKETLSIFGSLDYLINNASTYYPTPIERVDQSNWDDLIGTNLKAPLMLSKYASIHLKKTKGSIINITDANLHNPKKDYIIYTLAKSGLSSLTKSLAKELSPEIRVNAVAPGPILWPDESQEFDKDYRKKVISQTLLKKTGNPDDICQAIEFLLLRSPYITGQTLCVDGGRQFSF